MKTLAEIWDFREFFALLVRQHLELRYHGSMLGFAWTLLFPLLTVGVLSFVFAAVNSLPLADYGVYFFSGYSFWMVFNNSCLHAAESIVGNPHFVTGMRVPRVLLPLVSVVANLIDLVVMLGILILMMLAWGRPLPASLLFLPASIAIATLAIAACAILSSVANVFFRDFRYLLNSFLFLWFFLSPILWQVQNANPRVKSLVAWNPIVPFLSLFQDPIWNGVLPDRAVIAVTLAAGATLLAIGFGSFCRLEKRFYYYL